VKLHSAIRVLAIAAILAVSLVGQGSRIVWKTFNNRAGWSMIYPGDWKVGNCHACPNPTDPGSFAIFTPRGKNFPQPIQVNVMPYDSPPDSTLDDRLSQLEPFLVVGPYPSKRLRIKRITLNDVSAVTVRYLDSSSGAEIDYTLVPAGAETFLISFFPGKPGPIEDRSSYADYLKMRNSFRVKPARGSQ
jgi:hypothetical protein